MLLEGFSHHVWDGPSGPVAYARGGAGVPVVLLHGFPQTHAMWHGIAPALTAAGYDVVCPDLRGYGASAKPHGTEHFSFRAMGSDILALLDHLGLAQVHLVGHDRGGRVSHRLALDAPERFASLTVMDIAPTHTLLRDLTNEVATAYYHWFFLAQASPLPERMIGADPDSYYESCLHGWSTDDAPAFNSAALEAYRAAWRNPDCIRCMCEDYRAGVTLDFDIDAQDLNARVTCPALVLYGAGGLMDRAFDMQTIWDDKLTAYTAHGLPGGHFFPDLFPEQTVDRLLTFLTRTALD